MNGRTEQVAKNSRDRHYDVDARPAQLFERYRFDVRRAVETITKRAHAEQPQRLGHAFALRLYVVEPPKHEGHGFGITPVLLFVAIEQTGRDDLPARESNRGWHAVRIDRVCVSSGRQDVGVLNDVRARPWLDELAAQRTNERIHLVVCFEICRDILKEIEERPGFESVFFHCCVYSVFPEDTDGIINRFLGQRANPTLRTIKRRDHLQQIAAFSRGRWAAEDVQTSRYQPLLYLEQLLVEFENVFVSGFCQVDLTEQPG